MADELRKQKGDVDVLSLARELGTPVALVSATTGEGLIAVQNFLASATASPEPLELPVVGSTRGYREWAVRVGQNAGYRRPATTGLDGASGCALPAPAMGAHRLRTSGDWRLPGYFCSGTAALKLAAKGFSTPQA